MFQTTRRRLALWYAIVTAILLLLFAIAIYSYFRSTLVDRMDDTLKHVVEVVERSLIIETPDSQAGFLNIEASFHNNTPPVEDDRIDLEWFSPNGELMWSTLSDPLTIPIQIYPTAKTVQVTPDYWLRQVTKRIESGRQVLGYLRVSHPWFEVTKPSRQLIFDLALWTAIGVSSVAWIGWWLSGIAIQPVRDSYQSLKQFTADASHELRNPIATIQTNVQALLTYPETDPQFQLLQLQAIERLTQRLGRLVNDLLFLARSDSGIVETQLQTLPLDALLIEIIEEQRLFAEQKGIYLSLQITEPQEATAEALGEDIFAVKGDWDRLARLFTNLVSNALEHSIPEDRTADETIAVAVKIQRLEKDRQTWLQVDVCDTGQGIPEDAIAHIFDRFYRVDPSRFRSNTSGTGLGLAIAIAIVEHHHGHISVTSQPAVGTTFTVLLPAA
ncbi:MAG: HAMP domain-containing sensor histidine kinase [Jaaginema sp. PMC 1079.18]|nr:HAMP domain-containing sensor histidine kinase [Jaaginema sp. PMC 1080.18]MEC4853551.1 HAMP domain-containing sensor histidine kinase [Jaaginema sp. PMC 1079.18]MEC4865537.1 HAMP domain-containing sensor histidine kinase [Jaaginema sp. PMC 1078.18]